MVVRGRLVPASESSEKRKKEAAASEFDLQRSRCVNRQWPLGLCVENMCVKWSEWECIIVLVHLSRCPAQDINLAGGGARGMDLLEPHHIRALLDFT